MRGAQRIVLQLPPSASVRSAAIDGVAVPIAPAAVRVFWEGWLLLVYDQPPADGGVFDLVVDGSTPVDAIVTDARPGLPESADALLRARPPELVAAGDGDATMVVLRVRL
jgi:hypothetical protein